MPTCNNVPQMYKLNSVIALYTKLNAQCELVTVVSRLLTTLVTIDVLRRNFPTSNI